jgi:hypothetical protein
MGRRVSIVRPARTAPFPRPGEPIVPRLLRDVLFDRHPNPQEPEVDLHAVGNLGAAAWMRFPPEVCRRVGTAVVDRVQSRLQGLPAGVLDAPLPDPSTVLAFTLERRTANTVRRAFTAARVTGQWSLRRYLGLPRFGGRAVVDLLAAVEGHGRVFRAPGDRAADATIDVVVASLPISERRAHRLLAAEDVRPAIDLAGLARTAVLGGAPVPFRMVELGGTKIAVGPSQVTATQAAYRLARRSVRGWGAASIRAIAAQLRGAPGFDGSSLFVERVLAEIDSFRWIDRRQGWFLFAGEPNPLLEELKQVLSARSQTSLAALRALLYRTRGGPRFSMEALATICAEIPEVRSEGDQLRLDQPASSISASERAAVRST